MLCRDSRANRNALSLHIQHSREIVQRQGKPGRALEAIWLKMINVTNVQCNVLCTSFHRDWVRFTLRIGYYKKGLGLGCPRASPVVTENSFLFKKKKKILHEHEMMSPLLNMYEEGIVFCIQCTWGLLFLKIVIHYCFPPSEISMVKMQNQCQRIIKTDTWRGLRNNIIFPY